MKAVIRHTGAMKPMFFMIKVTSFMKSWMEQVGIAINSDFTVTNGCSLYQRGRFQTALWCRQVTLANDVQPENRLYLPPETDRKLK